MIDAIATPAEGLLAQIAVITVAAGFPTTVNPLLQSQFVPVFVDVTLPTDTLDVSQLEAEAALSPRTRTRAIILAHTLSNPFDLASVTAFAREHHLWLIEEGASCSVTQGRTGWCVYS